MVTTTRDDFSGKCACECRVDVRSVGIQTEETRISLGLDGEFSSRDCDQYESVFVLSPLKISLECGGLPPLLSGNPPTPVGGI